MANELDMIDLEAAGLAAADSILSSHKDDALTVSSAMTILQSDPDQYSAALAYLAEVDPEDALPLDREELAAEIASGIAITLDNDFDMDTAPEIEAEEPAPTDSPDPEPASGDAPYDGPPMDMDMSGVADYEDYLSLERDDDPILSIDETPEAAPDADELRVEVEATPGPQTLTPEQSAKVSKHVDASFQMDRTENRDIRDLLEVIKRDYLQRDIGEVPLNVFEDLLAVHNYEYRNNHPLRECIEYHRTLAGDNPEHLIPIAELINWPKHNLQVVRPAINAKQVNIGTPKADEEAGLVHVDAIPKDIDKPGDDKKGETNKTEKSRGGDGARTEAGQASASSVDIGSLFKGLGEGGAELLRGTADAVVTIGKAAAPAAARAASTAVKSAGEVLKGSTEAGGKVIDMVQHRAQAYRASLAARQDLQNEAIGKLENGVNLLSRAYAKYQNTPDDGREAESVKLKRRLSQAHNAAKALCDENLSTKLTRGQKEKMGASLDSLSKINEMMQGDKSLGGIPLGDEIKALLNQIKELVSQIARMFRMGPREPEAVAAPGR